MKILVKNLKQVEYPVELDNDQITVQALKSIIQKVHNLEENSLKLIFNGVVLEDNKLLSDYKIQDGSILIMMLSKIKPIHMNQSQPIPNPQPSTEDKKKNEEDTKKETKPKVNKPKKEIKQEQEKDYTNEVKALVEMGFEKEQALLALKAAKGNIQLAVEYLYNGLPIEATQEEEEMEEEEEEPQITEKDELKAAASVVKILYAQDPTSLEDLIMNLEESDPSLMKLIKDHEEEFQNLINEPINDEDLRNFDEFQKQLGGESQMGTPSHSEEYSTIQITPEEAAAIQRLINLCGLSEAEVTQAYFACDKNEELAANFLLESKFNNQNNNGNNNQGGSHQ